MKPARALEEPREEEEGGVVLEELVVR